ncbi:MAG: orotidine-5'-phosphate decarboxylase [Bacillota bacterium]
MKAAERIIVALDTPDIEIARGLVEVLTPEFGHFKTGLEFFCSGGPEAVRNLQTSGAELFLDLKLHDIPNTVGGAARALGELGVWMTNLHASGGPEMMRTAREALPDALLLAVTVLTSFAEEDFRSYVGTSTTVEDTVRRWAVAAKESGLDGVVCSPKEIVAVREEIGKDFLIVTPGIRPRWAAKGDQRRVTTPAEALELGADYLVIGRPITASPDPREAAERIAKEIEGSGVYDY